MPRAYSHGPHLYRRGRTWYARGGALRRGGVSLRTEDRAEAERRFRALLAAERSAAGAPAPRATLTECLVAWTTAPHGYTRRTLQTHEERVAAVARWLLAHGCDAPDGITPGLLDAWTTERAQTVSRATINRDLRSLRVCLRWCASRGLCAPVPALAREGLREARAEGHRLLPDPAEVSRVLGAIPTQGYRDALVTYYATGLRYEELTRVTVGDLRDGRLHVSPERGPAATAEPGKSYRERVVPLAPEVRAVLVRHLAWRDPSKRGRSADKKALHRAIRKACELVRVPPFGLHDLRRCFATEAVRRGTPLTVVRDWLGHRLTATTERYVGRYRSDAALAAPAVALAPGLLAAADSAAESPGGLLRLPAATAPARRRR